MKDIKDIDKSAKPLEKTTTVKKHLTEKDLFSEVDFIVKSGNSLWQLIFCFEKMKPKISVEHLLRIMYLKDLYLFSYKITVENTSFTVKDLIKRELVKKDLSNNDGLYKLTDYSNSLISEFNTFFLEKDGFINQNRKTDIDLNSKIKSVLSRFL